jgi:hypothetical protein
MKQLTARIISAGIIVLLLAGLSIRPEPALAGISQWSAETIPGSTGNMLGPAGIDIRDYVIGNDNLTIYAVPDNIAGTNIYKSTNAGISWSTITLQVGFHADLIAVAPDDNNYVVYADNSTTLYLSIDGGTNWNSLGVPTGATVIRDIAVSPLNAGKHYIMAAGQKGVGVGNLWYFLPYSNVAPTWQDTNTLPGFTSQSEVTTIAFSPNFAADAALVAVTDNITTGVNLQVLDFTNPTNLQWNNAALFTGFPCSVTTSVSGILSASLKLSPTFDGTDETSRDVFIGLTLNGDTANSGIYRFNNTVNTPLLTNKQIHSLAYNGGYLMAGSYSDRTVYRVQNPLTTTWTVTAYNSLKSPGGDNRVLVGLIGSTVTAGTRGNESAFSVSRDNGASFTDISLIDTSITSARDVAVTADAGKIYLVTDDGTDTSVWYEISGAWTRVLNLRGTTDYFVRAERQSGGVIYVAKKGGSSTTIYTNGNSGSGQWQTQTCPVNVQDIAVESSSVVYALDPNGKVTKSASAGEYWTTAVDTLLASGNMIYSVSTNVLLVGSQNGYIAYTFDGNATWTVITQPFPGAGKMQVVPDQNFASNRVIYAASQATGTDIDKWQIGTSTAWTDIFNGLIAGGIYGLAIDSDTLYALEYNTGTTQSTLWRFTAPINATAVSQGWVGVTTTPADGIVVLDAAPQALKMSTSKLWAVKTNATNKLYSFTDSLSGITLTLSQPQTGFTVGFNTITGTAYDVVLTWTRPGVATAYELDISTDPTFMQLVSQIPVIPANPTDDPVSVFIGPSQPAPRKIDFSTGLIYYWKVRITQPGYSVFSEIRSFSIGPAPLLPAAFIQLNSPANGATLADNTPSFSWQPLQGSHEYEFSLSDNPTMSSPLLNAKVDTAGIHVLRKLEGGKTYYWRVRVTLPNVSDWSPVGNFFVAKTIPTTTQAAIPVPTTPTFTIKLPRATETDLIIPPPDSTTKKVVPGYLAMAIFIALVLVSTVVYLIFKRPARAALNNGAGGSRVSRPVNNVKQPIALQGKSSIPLKATAPPVNKPLSPVETPQAVFSSDEKKTHPLAPLSPGKPPEKTNGKPFLGKSKDAATVIFAAKSFMWISGAEPGTTPATHDKEREVLGKKLAGRIRELAKNEPLYIKHPEDAALLLTLWARYGSRDETSKYLANSFKSRPENAVRLIKCFIPQGITPVTPESADFFNRDSYKLLAEVVDTNKIYATLTQSSKFKLKSSKEPVRVSPADSNLISRFIHLHVQEKKSG